MNENTRIKLGDSVIDATVKLAQGNPGAIKVLVESIKSGPIVDKQSVLKEWTALISLDALGIYGPRIWMLYKYVCKEEIVLMLAVLRALQLGVISEKALNKAIDNYGEGLDVDDLLLKVKEELDGFDVY